MVEDVLRLQIIASTENELKISLCGEYFYNYSAKHNIIILRS